jgi:hypothetical protein
VERDSVPHSTGASRRHIDTVQIANVIDLQHHVVPFEKLALVVEPPRQPKTPLTVSLADAA